MLPVTAALTSPRSALPTAPRAPLFAAVPFFEEFTVGRILIILLSFTLVACGNPDLGKIGRKSASKTDGATATPSTPSSGAAFGNCHNFTVYAGTAPNFAQNFNGASACASTSQLNLVRVKTSAYFPTDTRVCLVPLSFRGASNATCFAINGQLEVSLSTDQFTAVTMVRESDLGAYVSYLSGTSASYPAMGYANLR